MPSTEALKVAVQEAIDRRGQELIEVATTILHHPEPGFREQKSSQLVARKFHDFGIPFEEGIALTGLKGMLETGNAGPSVAVLAVPAEEYIEIAYRDQLRREGKIEFLGGKPEFIRLGALDDVDLAMMTHTSSSQTEHGKI